MLYLLRTFGSNGYRQNCVGYQDVYLYDFSVFLDIEPKLQELRVNKRNSPEMAERFFEEWIPLEQRYFEAMKVKERCNMVISIFE